ncbi:glutamate 5-kinase [Peptoniphilus sp. KCTC 25270]|uniref:glutamate 5-kinase n=1 Tax=Peptoniphilus sp. KCTC 25270 TaxID=2897414 RepID=UPI001E388215|nr:glutamate 5-kinase [Peptoniphilus sp. KCTC 25270]MCD1146715.1 glutamate 5-kinase [Peptoniphilus sp. KCTC 25270]
MRKFSREIKKVVIKVGTSSMTHENGNLNLEFIDNLTWELSNLKNAGLQVVLVSSGSIAAGAKRLNLPERPRDTIGKQAASAVGQVTLMQLYHKAFNAYGYQAAQVLLTKQIERDKTMYENGRNTFEKLMEMNTIPIVNENDAISTYEIEFGDNDTLSALVAGIVEADLLILLTDIDGLYDDDPRKNPGAQRIEEVEEIDERFVEMAKDTESKVGTGGMSTKIKAAKKAVEKGIPVVIASAEDTKNIRNIIGGEKIGTYFKPNID